MTKGLRRYQFSERLADILGESRRDLRFRVTLLVTAGVVEPGPRGRGSPPASSAYAADLLIGVMAAPRQRDTAEAVRCYRALAASGDLVSDAGPKVVVRSAAEDAHGGRSPDIPLLRGRPAFGQALSRLLDLACQPENQADLYRRLFGVWVSRSFPVAAIQWIDASRNRQSVWTQRYELASGQDPPDWLNPQRGGRADPGLMHTAFLPSAKLIEIGLLTTTEPERNWNMFEVNDPSHDLHERVRHSRHGRAWETFLDQADAARRLAQPFEHEPGPLLEVAEFGPNPGDLRMFTYLARSLPEHAPLVVALHGCTQDAASYVLGGGWLQLAERRGFALLAPQQKQANNPMGCFNWFLRGDFTRGGGESLSIRQMVDRMIRDHGLDPKRVYVAGLSAGGAMTSVLLAAYPEVFAGGAVIAGAPYRCANGVQDALNVIAKGTRRSPRAWGNRVRTASPHQRNWPKVSVWHGDQDSTVNPLNGEAVVSQWINVHGLSAEPGSQTSLQGHRRQTWQGPDGEALVEWVTVTGMGHGQAIDSRGSDPCGVSGPFFVDVGVAAARCIADFWGLAELPIAAKSPTRPSVVENPGDFQDGFQGKKAESGTSSGDRRGRRRKERPAVSDGVDIGGILAKSFELAGLATRSASGGGAAGGPDVQGIVAASLELARLATETSAPSPPPGDPAGTEWKGEGWREIEPDGNENGRGTILYGEAVSGADGRVGEIRRPVACRLMLGKRPRLTYLRRLELAATPNPFTRAEFKVLIDGLPVDEVSAQGMDHREDEWTIRNDIDLMPFAEHDVVLTFEIAANSNVLRHVSAKVWLRDIQVSDDAV